MMNSTTRVFAVLLLISFAVIVLFYVSGRNISSSQTPSSEFILLSSSGDDATASTSPPPYASPVSINAAKKIATTPTATSSPTTLRKSKVTPLLSPPKDYFSPSSSSATVSIPDEHTLSKMTSSCAALLQNDDNVGFVINAKAGIVRASSSSSSSSNQQQQQVSPLSQFISIPTCPIDKATPGKRKLHSILEFQSSHQNSSSSSSSICSSSSSSLKFDLVLAGDLYRPQHTMQFLFGLMGLVALQSEFNLYEKKIPVFVNIMRYAVIDSVKQFCTNTFQHFKLLELLEPPLYSSDVVGATGENVQRKFQLLYLFRDAEWKSFTVPAPPLSYQLSQKLPIASKCFSKEEAESSMFSLPPLLETDERDENNFCAKKILWGSIPLRIPGKKIKPDPNLKPKHFQDFRRRIMSRWLHHDDEDASSNIPSHIPSNHILLVRREKENGRFLHKDQQIAKLVKDGLTKLDQEDFSKTEQEREKEIKIVSVYWEKMKIEDQLRLVVNARAMIGVHGNGLTWACFMPEGSFLFEFSSNIRKRNEVFEGINIANAGNIAQACGLKSLSLLAPWVESDKTKAGESTYSPNHKWKLVDIEPGNREFEAVETFLKTNGTRYV